LSNKKDKTLINGEPDIFLDGSVRRIDCCDCGLSHLVVTEGESVQMVYRDDFRTKKNRKTNKITIYRREK